MEIKYKVVLLHQAKRKDMKTQKSPSHYSNDNDMSGGILAIIIAVLTIGFFVANNLI